MRVHEYFKSLAAELDAMKHRVRYMIEDGHWPTDGEWKESVLRSVLRRSAPASVSIGRGFVVSNMVASGQLDVLIHDNNHPVLYRDGDLVFATASSCRAIIEVKTKLNRANYRAACIKLAETAQLIRAQQQGTRTFVGLFCYETDRIDAARAVDIAKDAAEGDPMRVIDHVSLGDAIFLKHWTNNPRRPLCQAEGYNRWHAYELPRMAAGYFIHNLLMHLSARQEPESDAVWFPEETKENRLVKIVPLNG